MRYLTAEEGARVIFSANYRHPGIRLGQSLFNELPEEISQRIVGTENDFFHWKDESAVWRVFYRECVGNEW